MKKTVAQLISWILALCLILSVVPAGFADTGDADTEIEGIEIAAEQTNEEAAAEEAEDQDDAKIGIIAIIIADVSQQNDAAQKNVEADAEEQEETITVVTEEAGLAGTEDGNLSGEEALVSAAVDPQTDIQPEASENQAADPDGAVLADGNLADGLLLTMEMEGGILEEEEEEEEIIVVDGALAGTLGASAAGSDGASTKDSREPVVFSAFIGVTEDLPTKADVVFVIDSTGSMSDEINNVRKNLNGFTETLDESNLNFNIAIVEYKDITVYSERNSTKIITDSTGNEWFSDADQVASLLSGIRVNGGGDLPETVIDALGAVVNDLSFRYDASKFAILLTDASYKNNNNYGYANMDEMIAALKKAGINTSVISDNYYKSTYYDLYTDTDGIFCNIYGQFADELAIIAEHISEVTVTRPVEVYTFAEEEQWDNIEAQYTLLVNLKATDTENTAENVSVTLSVPDNFIVEGSLVQTIGSIAPGESKSLQWRVNVPIKEKNETYTWSATVNSEDFAVGTLIKAQDTFQVIGRGENDYNWVFGQDNYSFLNNYAAFGNKGESYYISDDDLAFFLKQLSNTEIDQLAAWYGAHGTTEDLENNDLIAWNGSCYGMSLSAALYKIGMLDPSYYKSASGKDAKNTYDIRAITSGTNTELESMINLYHISQATDVAMDSVRELNGTAEFVPVIQAMWDKAVNIGKKDTAEQPYIVRLGSPRGGHAVVCYGGEEGSWQIGSQVYTKRLFIADPNESSKTYIYIADDDSRAVYSADSSYNKFGYRKATLSALDTYDYTDLITNRDIQIAANDNTDLVLETSKGKVVIIAGKMVAVEGDVKYTAIEKEGMIAGVDEDTNGEDVLYKIVSEDAVTVSPYKAGKPIDALISVGGYSAKVSGKVDNVSLNEAGDISLSGASGDFVLNISADDSDFDFITIEGAADGDVSISLGDDHMDITGDLSGYKVGNKALFGESTGTTVTDIENSRFVLEGGKVVAYFDLNGDGVYETRQKDSAPEYTLSNVQYSGSHLTGKLVKTAGSGSAENLRVRVTFYLSGNIYMSTYCEVDETGFFSADAVGLIQYITALAVGEQDGVTTRLDAAELFL